MATKTLTITESAYHLLRGYKLEEESFSEEITRLLTNRNKRTFKDLFGLVTEDIGNKMLADLEKQKNREIKLLKKRVL